MISHTHLNLLNSLSVKQNTHIIVHCLAETLNLNRFFTLQLSNVYVKHLDNY